MTKLSLFVGFVFLGLFSVRTFENTLILFVSKSLSVDLNRVGKTINVRSSIEKVEFVL